LFSIRRSRFADISSSPRRRVTASPRRALPLSPRPRIGASPRRLAPQPPGPWPQALLCLAALTALTLPLGCGPRVTRIELETYDAAGQPSRHYTEFTRAAFKQISDGRIELVLRSEQPSQIDPTQTITQVVHVQTFWTPRLGITYAEASQINARIQYAILTPPTGVRYDGGAFVSYKIDGLTGELVGWIESGELSPKFQMGNAVEPFGPARISGTFRAVENPGEVVTTHQMLRSQFTQTLDRE